MVAVPLGLFILMLAWSVNIAFGDDQWLWWTAFAFIAYGLVSTFRVWRQNRIPKPRITFDPVDEPDEPYI